MPYIDTNGVKVNFPFDPYPCQVDYMRSVVACLKQGQNGALESPTGTGKTLCLLCSCLAWLEDKKAQITSNKWKVMSAEPEQAALDVFKTDLAQQLDQAAGQWGGEVAPPKIIYASRTHSQLTQVVQELKRTAYSHFRVCVLGSREQMCIHPQVTKEESNTVKVHMCRAKVSARSCHFYNGVENAKANFTNTVMDIEDMVRMGKKFKCSSLNDKIICSSCCPYYMSRELKSEADIIFLPYNYLLDPKSRKAHGIELQGNIVIFDEAHNLEKMCEESSSFDLTSAEIAAAVREINDISTKLQELVESEEGAAFGSETPMSSNDFTLEDVLQVKMVLLELERELDEIPLPHQDEGITRPGRYIFDIFTAAKLTFGTQASVTEVLDKLTSYLSNGSGTSVFSSKGTALSKFNDVIKVVFSRPAPENQEGLSSFQKDLSRHYKVHIRYTPQDFRKKKTNDGWGAAPKTQKRGRTLSYWCFSPGHAMQDLVSRGVRSIILTSGTLSPMDSFKSEMSIDFGVELENPHVIGQNQVWVGVVGRGPDGVALSSAYKTRFREDYQASLGNSIVNFSRVVPNGLLLFFPSYPVMDKCIETWQRIGVWGRVEQYKPFYVEPRNKTEFHCAMESYYEKVNDVTGNGAVFAAVCRGKVSEGLDFADNNGRAVVITGLPFPPRMDPRVVLKMKYLDEALAYNKKGLSGELWYSQQASRAVNQAVGRVIRHKNDFGAIILCDDRFGSIKSRNQLPSWVRPYYKIYSQFGLALRDMMGFFKFALKELPTPRPNKKPIREMGCKGAHFEPTLRKDLENAGKLKVSSAVDTHVPSLQQPCGSSMGTLSAQYRGSRGPSAPSSTTTSHSLLHALDVTDKTVGDDMEENSSQMSSFKNLLRDSQDSRLKPKRKILVKDRVVKSEVNQISLESAEQYVAQVRKVLSSTTYKLFSTAMTEYRKSEDYDQLISRLADIFLDSPEKHILFRKFYRFVRPQHKKQFNEACVNLLGYGCCEAGDVTKKRSATAAATAESEKKRKIDCMEIKNTKFTSAGRPENNIPSSIRLDPSANMNKGLAASCSSVNPSLGQAVKTSDVSHAASVASPRDSPSSMAPPDSSSVRANSAGSKSCNAGGKENLTAAGESEAMKVLNTSEKAGEDTSGSSIFKSNTGYTCCKCGDVAVVPLKAGCDHVCCMECWKAAISESQCCPRCNQKTKRKHLRRIYFSSGPNNTNS